MHLNRWWWAWLMGLSLLLACTREGSSCVDSSACAGDQTCQQGVCVKRTCKTSQDCELGSHCDPLSNLCASGCVEDADCRYGESCSEGKCGPKPCRSTQLDCSVGEYCDPFTGTCYAAAGPFCKPCTSSSDCGDGTSVCTSVGGGRYCAPACDDDHPCPAGYTCTEFTSSQQVVSYHCVTLCNNLDELPPRTTRLNRSTDWLLQAR
ncbi:MAG: hypothetical protein ACKO6N_25315 [Myxococcota bacterium]